MQLKDGQEAAEAFGNSKPLQLASLLTGDPEYDAHLESAQDYMKKQKLDFITLS